MCKVRNGLGKYFFHYTLHSTHYTVLIGLLLCTGCAHTLPATMPSPALMPSLKGSYYQVQPGDTLWRIAQWFGLEVEELARHNRLSDPTKVEVGQNLFIPMPPESSRFLWPLHGRIRRGSETVGVGGAPVKGLSIHAPEGSFVRASRTGRVAVASHHLAGWGKTVLLDHRDGYVTVYTGFEQLFVSPGASVRQGMPLGKVGAAPLYFEIRYGSAPYDPLRWLP